MLVGRSATVAAISTLLAVLFDPGSPARSQGAPSLQKEMIGDWAMVRRNGQSICGLTLTNTETTADNFQVFLKPRCDPAVAAFAPTMWRLERGGLLLMSAGGEVWRFEADDNAQWRRVPDSADPLIMVRQ